ncbi:MAG TPA: dUTP diphosphatase, partial [Mucilaginibacter sp.]|nr:dUTP diphosphatase [Mucilaginibacter sp.]
MNIRIINRSKNVLPAYETLHTAGMDLRADVEETVLLK